MSNQGDQIDSIVKRLLILRNRVSTERNPRFTKMKLSILTTEYREVFPLSNGNYTLNTIGYQRFFSESLEATDAETLIGREEESHAESTKFYLWRNTNCKLETHPADIHLAADGVYHNMVEAGYQASSLPIEGIEKIAEFWQEHYYFEDCITGRGYYGPSGENTKFSGFSLESLTRLKDRPTLTASYQFNNSRQVLSFHGRQGTTYNEVEEFMLRSMEQLLNELEPWVHKVLDYNSQK